MKTVLTTLGISLLVLAGCAGQKQAESNFIQENIDNAVAQETIQTDIIEKSGKILNPRTIERMGTLSMYLSTIGVPASSPVISGICTS